MVKAGVYLIQHRPSGKVYVGSSSRLTQRLATHRRQLYRGQIRERHKLGAQQKELAKEFGICGAMVSNIVHYRSWRVAL